MQERFGDKPIIRQDMLGSFINRGLSQDQLESEALTQMFVIDSDPSSLIICTDQSAQHCRLR